MLKRMANWVFGRNEKWLKTPRLVPEEYRDLPPGNDKFVMSQEYANPKFPNNRYYMSAMLSPTDPDAPRWEMRLHTRDLAKGDEYVSTRFQIAVFDPGEVIGQLQSFEARCVKDELTPLDHAPATYREFAVMHGYGFDNKGKYFRITTESPLQHDTLMTGAALAHAFEQAEMKKPISDWALLYARIVNNPPVQGVTLQDLATDDAWPAFEEQSRDMLKKLQRLGAYLNDPAFGISEKRETLAHIVKYVIVDPLSFSISEKMKLAQHSVDATIMVGLLRAAGEVYREQLTESFEPENLRLVKLAGEICAQFAAERFGIDEAIAAPVADIVAQGQDPNGPELPLEKYLRDGNDLRANPPAPAAPVQAEIAPAATQSQDSAEEAPAQDKPAPQPRRSSNGGWPML